jgi:hypothetical protein
MLSCPVELAQMNSRGEKEIRTFHFWHLYVVSPGVQPNFHAVTLVDKCGCHPFVVVVVQLIRRVMLSKINQSLLLSSLSQMSMGYTPLESGIPSSQLHHHLRPYIRTPSHSVLLCEHTADGGDGRLSV